MAKRQFFLFTDLHRANAHKAIDAAERGCRVAIYDPQRSLSQNDRLHAMIDDVSEQIGWQDMFGRPQRMTPAQWKRFFAAMWVRACGGSSTVVPNEDGTGFYDLSVSTTELSVREAGDLMELVSAFGAQRGVVFHDPGEPSEPKRKSKVAA